MDSGYFTEQVFPLYGVRFISVSDNFDSNDYKGDTGGIDVAFKFLMHEYYSQDLSKKVKSAKRVKMRRGENIVANAPYGYRKNSAGKWEPDGVAAEVVALMFKLALDGLAPAAIRDRLFQLGYPTPKEHIEMKRNADIVPTCHWEAKAVTRTLTNEQYTGTYISGKQESVAIGSHSKVLVDKSKWIVIPDSHTPLVSKEDFERVQVLMAEYFKGRTETLKTEEYTKITSRQQTRMESGEKIPQIALYGYIHGANGKMELNPPAADVVRQIFQMTLDGKNVVEISEHLTKSGCHTPREQMKLDKGGTVTERKAWTRTAVAEILKNIQYTGACVSGKKLWEYAEVDGKMVKKAHVKTPQSEWIIIKNHKPAIVSEDDFNAVQELLSEKNNGKRKQTPLNYLLKGKVKCGICGYSLSFDAGCGEPVFRCYHTAADPNADCYKMKVVASQFDEAVLAIIRKQAEVILGASNLGEVVVKTGSEQTTADYEKRITECNEQRQRLYERFVLREIDKMEFQKLKAECGAEIDRLNKQAAAMKFESAARAADSKIQSIAKQVIDETLANRELVETLVEKINVYPDKRIEIEWRVADFMKV
jgi:hypothetical protein